MVAIRDVHYSAVNPRNGRDEVPLFGAPSFSPVATTALAHSLLHIVAELVTVPIMSRIIRVQLRYYLKKELKNKERSKPKGNRALLRNIIEGWGLLFCNSSKRFCKREDGGSWTYEMNLDAESKDLEKHPRLKEFKTDIRDKKGTNKFKFEGSIMKRNFDTGSLKRIQEQKDVLERRNQELMAQVKNAVWEDQLD
ncbi:hypothetical protein M9H77_09506 [Catharanthus roseus]|uniref:Uncharacterized protein n=1 Tax=Catharanthus roseus TaxID=4058 RepID=A0ACC0C0U4_CATRO|nr:hypothetical protein M9H77_09506 [Catharanthus roseus]